MPMKTVADVPADVILAWCSCSQDEVIQFCFQEAGDLPRVNDLGALDIVLTHPEFRLYAADNIQAEHGWGPFLVDVAMEWVAARDGWLYPHPIGIVPSAKVMWKTYFTKRPDIESEPMEEEIASELGVQHQEPELRCFYRKPTASIITALVNQGRWKSRT
jgi:hypothetical protein